VKDLVTAAAERVPLRRWPSAITRVGQCWHTAAMASAEVVNRCGDLRRVFAEPVVYRVRGGSVPYMWRQRAVAVCQSWAAIPGGDTVWQAVAFAML
jgi:hypothetical protein